MLRILKITIKVTLIIVLIEITAGSLWANGKNENTAKAKKSTKLHIGIAKFIAHPALNALEMGLMDVVQDAYIHVEFDNQNAFGDMTSAFSIAHKFKADRVDIAVGIATPTAVALADTIDDIPVIFSAVTDPVDAGLVPSLHQSAGNITGILGMAPVKDQLELLASLIELETLGHVYSQDEPNAVRVEQIARESCETMGIEFISVPIASSAEIAMAAQSIIDKIDAIYVGTDNTVVSNISALTEVAVKAGIPVMGAGPDTAKGTDVALAWGYDYYKMGQATGRLILEVVQGANPGSIPTRFMTSDDDMELFINLRITDELGISIPDSLLIKASTIVR